MSDFPNCSFFVQNEQMANRGCRVGQSLIRSSFISSPSKRAIERSLAHLLFEKERLSDRSFRRSLQKGEGGIAIFKRATKRAIALSLFQKERLKEWSLFHSFKKSERAKMRDRSFSKWANAQPWFYGYFMDVQEAHSLNIKITGIHAVHNPVYCTA